MCGGRPKTSTVDPEAEALRAAQKAAIASNEDIAARKVRVSRDRLPSALVAAQGNGGNQSALTKLGAGGNTGANTGGGK